MAAIFDYTTAKKKMPVSTRRKILTGRFTVSRRSQSTELWAAYRVDGNPAPRERDAVGTPKCPHHWTPRYYHRNFLLYRGVAGRRIIFEVIGFVLEGYLSINPALSVLIKRNVSACTNLLTRLRLLLFSGVFD
jgi:hypothetical protein